MATTTNYINGGLPSQSFDQNLSQNNNYSPENFSLASSPIGDASNRPARKYIVNNKPFSPVTTPHLPQYPGNSVTSTAEMPNNSNSSSPQHPYNNPYFQGENYNIPLASSNLSKALSSSQRQLQYLHCMQQVQRIQRQLEPIKRPWWLWFIGIVDILSAFFWTAKLVYNVFTKPFLEPDAFIWKFFLGSLDMLLIIMMGGGLLAGLRSKDDSSTLWYCKLWVGCQLVFLIGSSVQGFICLLMYASGEADVTVPLFWLFVFLYRIVSFILVKCFITKLRKSESGFQGCYEERGEGEEVERQREYSEGSEINSGRERGAGESSYCGPSVALIMSL